MKKESRLLLKKEFLTGYDVNNCQDLVNQKFGYNHNGYHFYNALALAVLTSFDLDVIEQVVDEMDSGRYKDIDVTIDGSIFWQSYTDGFKIGLSEFKERPLVPYGEGSQEFARDLHKLYRHGDDQHMSWLREAKLRSRFISNRIFRNYGIFAGLCYGVDKLVSDYPSLHDAIYNCGDQTISEIQVPHAGQSLRNQVLDYREVRQIVDEILAPLDGVNPQRQKIMTSEDFERLIEYTTHLALHDSPPENTRIIEQISISDEHIRYTFYRLHKRLFTTKAIRQSFINFLHEVFRQFDGYNMETTRKKFSTVPKSYFSDFNISL